MDRVLGYGMASPQDVAALQKRANDDARQQYARSSLSGLSADVVAKDAGEALTGLMADLTGTTERRSLADMLMYKDRMRGLGVLLIVLALVGMVVDYAMSL